jgi:putative flippase GtrA
MKEKFNKIKERALEHKFVRFLVSGVTAFLFDLIVLTIISFLFFQGSNYTIFGIISLPKFISSCFGLSLVFYINKNWVFNSKNRKFTRQVPKFIAVSIFNIFFISVIFNIYYQFYSPPLSSLTLNPNLIKLIINGFTSVSSEGTKMLLSFFLYKYFVFN